MLGWVDEWVPVEFIQNWIIWNVLINQPFTERLDFDIATILPEFVTSCSVDWVIDINRCLRWVPWVENGFPSFFIHEHKFVGSEISLVWINVPIYNRPVQIHLDKDYV
jgi:hypothetical protein